MDNIPITRKVHHSAFVLMLRNVESVMRHKQPILEDIAQHITAQGTPITAEEIDRDWNYDWKTKALVPAFQSKKRYLLGIAEQVVLENVKRLEFAAREKQKIVVEEIAEQLKNEHGVNLSVDQILEDYQFEERPSGQATSVLIKRVTSK